MSRIDDLLAALCPDGVEFKAIGEVIHPTTNIKWSNISDEEFKYIDLTSVDRITHAIVNIQTISSANAPDRAQQIVRTGDVIFGTTRPMLRRYTVVPSEYDGGICSTGYCVLRPNGNVVLSNFIFHLLGTEEFYTYVEANERGASYPAISDSAVKAFRIPIPPLEVQRAIVTVLDAFTELEAELEAELKAELEARRQQYQHYRDALLTFADRPDVPWATLGEVCKSVSSGGTPLATNPDYYGGDIPWLRTQEVRYIDIHDTEIKITEKGLKQSAAKWIPANCVIVAISGATAARSAINKIPLTTNQHCCNLEIDPAQANYRYVFHWVSREYDRLKSLGQGARADLNSGIIKGYPIPVPSLDEQARIVGILDRFDALVNDLSSGLPAEIAARRQQYEFYRDRLLTFRELRVES